MPVFTIQAPDGRKIKIEAADQQTAVRGAQEWAAANPVGDEPASPPAQQAQPEAPQQPAPWEGQNVQQLRGTVTPQGQPPQPEQLQPNLAGATAATLSGIVNGIPVIGPMAQDITDRMQGAIAQIGGGDYGQTVDAVRARREAVNQANPIANVAGNLAGGFGAMGALAKVPGGMQAMGMTGAGGPLNTIGQKAADIGGRMLNSGVFGAGVSAADTLTRGGDLADAGESALIGGGIGAAIPGVGAGLGAAARAVGNTVGPRVRSVIDPAGEASRRAGIALQRDAAANPGSVMSSTDEMVARQTGVPIMNVDRGGETTRALARAAANQSPEARFAIEKAASDRFAGQAGRAVDAMRRIAGGSVDDLAYQDQLRRLSQAVNKPAYDAAFNAPQAQAVWNRPVQELMQSPTFRRAVQAAEGRGADRAAVDGFKAVKSPFTFDAAGNAALKRNADGSQALPSLQFWDQVKRNLDGQIGIAQRQGDRTLVADLTQLKNKLVASLDAVVPQYQRARAGAATFFGAEDALDAGKKFALAPRSVPEARAAFSRMKPAEKDAFRTGFASEIIDKIQDARFRANVIDQAFGTPAKREMMELVFGPGKARQLEAYIRVEELADRVRGAMGNSSTVRQWMELGIGATGGGVATGDWRGALGGAALARGIGHVGMKVNEQVMKEVGDILVSGDPAKMQRAVANAVLSQQWMDALRSYEQIIGAGARGALLPAS